VLSVEAVVYRTWWSGSGGTDDYLGGQLAYFSVLMLLVGSYGP